MSVEAPSLLPDAPIAASHKELASDNDEKSTQSTLRTEEKTSETEQSSKSEEGGLSQDEESPTLFDKAVDFNKQLEDTNKIDELILSDKIDLPEQKP